MNTKLAAAAARGATRELAKHPDVATELVTSAVSVAAGKAVDKATEAAPSPNLAHAADPGVPVGDALGTMLWSSAYLVAAAYLRQLTRRIEGS